MSSSLRYSAMLNVLSLTIVGGGCQRQDKWDLVPVEGIITQAGRPLVGVEVAFWTDIATGTKGPPTSGFTDADGRYELRTQGGERGAAAGLYRVCITRPPRPRPEPPSPDAQPETPKENTDQADGAAGVRVPPKFSRFDKTPLRAEVKPGEGQRFDFNIPEPPPRRQRKGTS